jgi:serine/threonine protein kinase
MNLVGETLGQFQIVEEVGKGGMATVYRAYQPNLQRYVAIKVLMPSLAEDMDLVKRFLREARSAAALHHPNVITIHDVGSQGDTHYIVSEYLEGMTLGDLLKQEGMLSLDRVLNITRQIADALDYAHSRGYIHRDIKPSNIMVDPQRNDHVTLMDFGLVQVTGGSKITRTGFIMGTPDYMSPEQAKGEAIDHRTDIYSLGVTAYHMVTGMVPFVKPTPHAILLAHIMEDPPHMLTPGRETPPEVESVVLKSMAKDPKDRYEWAGDLAKDLETAIRGETPVAMTATGMAAPRRTATLTAPAPETPPSGVYRYPSTPSSGVSSLTDTPPPGAPAYSQTPPPGAPAYSTTPLPGAPAYSATPPSGVSGYSAAPAAEGAIRGRPRWLWPVVAVAAFAVVAVLIVVGILIGPSVVSRLRSATPVVTPITQIAEVTPLPAAAQTAAAQTATAEAAAAAAPSPTSVPEIVRFEVRPDEITQGASVTLEWQVTGVESVSILPDVQLDAPPSGSMTLKPAQSTMYELVLPNGERRKQEVRVNPAPNAPVIEHFGVTPQEQVSGGKVELSWKVSGTITKIEISANFEMIPSLPAEGSLSVTVEQDTLFVLTAHNGDLSTSQSINLSVVEPTATPPAGATPTGEPAAPTPTPAPPTATPAPAAPTPTPKPAQPQPTSVQAPAAGVVVSFERWGTWKRGDQPYGTLEQTTEQVKSGTYAAKLSYEFPETDQDFVVFVQSTPLAGTPNTIRAWVYGDGSGHFVNVWIQDAQNEVWSVHLGKVGAAGWQQMSGRIDATRPWPSGRVYGPDNGTIDYPIRFYALVLDRPGSGPQSGTVYLDDISVAEEEAASPGEPTATPELGAPSPGQIGRIVFTVQVGESYALYSTDPNWNKMVKIGDTDGAHSTCTDGNVAVTLDGITVNLRDVVRCQVAGTVGSCLSPNGEYKVNTNRKGDGVSITLWRISDDKMMEAYYQGPLNIDTGLNWAPDSSHFLFTVDSSVYRCDVGQAGYRVIIPFKDNRWPLQYTGDGSQVFYLKPVSGAIADVFVANPDGTNERNLTNSPIATKLCPRWRQ